ncbi:MAG: nitroreductase [Bacteroidales bacterium]|nr:nitroreductase [Bacteroidales bacterium]
MEVLEALKARHSVRKYLPKSIDSEIVEKLRTAISEANEDAGLNIQLVLEEPRAFSSGILKYGTFSGVRNYLVMAGPKGKLNEEKIGYHGEKLVILAQSLGLNSCWVGLTYKKVDGAFSLRPDDTVHCVIALGYGEIPGVQHSIKPIERFYEAEKDELPEWFINGMQAAVLAPTAINQQKFKFILHKDGKVEARTQYSFAGYVNIDLGIVKYNFEVGAGKENFEWSGK